VVNVAAPAAGASCHKPTEGDGGGKQFLFACRCSLVCCGPHRAARFLLVVPLMENFFALSAAIEKMNGPENQA